MLLERAAEVGRICELLRDEDVRLVTLTGPGGVGKSRLGLRSAAVSAELFADGGAPYTHTCARSTASSTSPAGATPSSGRASYAS